MTKMELLNMLQDLPPTTQVDICSYSVLGEQIIQEIGSIMTVRPAGGGPARCALVVKPKDKSK